MGPGMEGGGCGRGCGCGCGVRKRAVDDAVELPHARPEDLVKPAPALGSGDLVSVVLPR